MTRKIALLPAALLLTLACDGGGQASTSPDEAEARPSTEPNDSAKPNDSGEDTTIAQDELVEDVAASAADDESEQETASEVEGVGELDEEIDTPEEDPDFKARGKDAGKVDEATLAVEGQLDREVIRRVAKSHTSEIRACYNQGLAKDPDLAGRVMIDFQINPKGKVASARPRGEFPDPKVAKCVAASVRRWQFPKPAGGGVVKVSYPFEFAPG